MARAKLDAFTSVGCYPILYLDEHENCLCATCATAHRDEGGRVVGDVYWEGEPIACDECGEEVESAYGVPSDSLHIDTSED